MVPSVRKSHKRCADVRIKGLDVLLRTSLNGVVNMKHAIVIMQMLAVLLAAQSRTLEENTKAIIEKLRKNPAEIGLVSELMKRSSDPQVIPTLRELFVEAKLSDATGPLGIRASQSIAGALIMLGVKDGVYFDEIAKYARDAIDANPPDTYALDSEGNETHNTYNPAFVEWCASRNLEPPVCTRRILRMVWTLIS